MLQEESRSQLGVDVPWMSYIGDFPAPEGLCRVYAHQSSGSLGLSLPAEGRARWCGADEIQQLAAQGELAGGYESEAITLWLDPSLDRGIGESGRDAASQSKA